MNSIQVFSSFFSSLSGLLKPNRLSILVYHRVLDERDYLRPDEPDVYEFDRQMGLISKHFSPISLTEGVEKLREGKLPRGAVSVTFDDGYADNERNALPVLEKWGIPATIFIATDFLDGGIMWNDAVTECIRSARTNCLDMSKVGLPDYDIGTPGQKCAAASDIIRRIKYFDQKIRADIVEHLVSVVDSDLPKDLMLTRNSLLKLSDSGVEIGGHTKSHPILSELQDKLAVDEIRGGREILADILGCEVKHFAYPNGKYGIDFHKRHMEMVHEAGYRYAFTTDRGVANTHTDPRLLPRFTPWDKTDMRYVGRLWLNALELNV